MNKDTLLAELDALVKKHDCTLVVKLCYRQIDCIATLSVNPGGVVRYACQPTLAAALEALLAPEANRASGL